jgi:modulator of FtsH protease HflC
MNRGIFGGLGLVIIAVVGIAAYLSVFVVDQTQQGLVLRFGQVVDTAKDPGLYYKLPLIDNVVYFDKRILDLDSPPLEIIASDQKRLVVDAWGRYKIIDPLKFYQSVGTIPVAESRLSVVLNSAVRRVLGDASFIQLVRDERAGLMGRITAQVDREAESLGIEVVDVKIQRADLPEANSQAIYQRMQTERQREATEIRAQGEQAARRIRAEADRTATIIVAEANRESETLRGEGEGQVNTIFAKAFGADPDFFAFYRSMQAYQTGLKGDDTRLVITPDSEFFRYFNDASGMAMPPRTPAEGATIPGAPATPATPPAPAAEVSPDLPTAPAGTAAAPQGTTVPPPSTTGATPAVGTGPATQTVQ